MPTKKQLLAKYGSPEAVSEHYRQMQKKSRQTYKGTGGFAAMDKQQVKAISKLGVAARQGKANVENQQTAAGQNQPDRQD